MTIFLFFLGFIDIFHFKINFGGDFNLIRACICSDIFRIAMPIQHKYHPNILSSATHIQPHTFNQPKHSKTITKKFHNPNKHLQHTPLPVQPNNKQFTPPNFNIKHLTPQPLTQTITTNHCNKKYHFSNQSNTIQSINQTSTIQPSNKTTLTFHPPNTMQNL